MRLRIERASNGYILTDEEADEAWVASGRRELEVLADLLDEVVARSRVGGEPDDPARVRVRIAPGKRWLEAQPDGCLHEVVTRESLHRTPAWWECEVCAQRFAPEPADAAAAGSGGADRDGAAAAALQLAGQNAALRRALVHVVAAYGGGHPSSESEPLFDEEALLEAAGVAEQLLGVMYPGWEEDLRDPTVRPTLEGVLGDLAGEG